MYHCSLYFMNSALFIESLLPPLISLILNLLSPSYIEIQNTNMYVLQQQENHEQYKKYHLKQSLIWQEKMKLPT